MMKTTLLKRGYQKHVENVNYGMFEGVQMHGIMEFLSKKVHPICIFFSEFPSKTSKTILANAKSVHYF